MKQYITLLALCLLSLSVWLPSAQAMGEWNIYNATPATTRLQSLGDRLYTISGSSLCSYSTDSIDDDFMRLNRITGLSGSAVQFICTIPETERMAIAYADGNLDIMEPDGTIHNIPDLANKTMTGDKSLYALNYSGHQLYVSCGFGMMVVDVDQYMITQSYSTPYPILFSFGWGSCIYRYSEHRHLEVGETSLNLLDNSQWRVASTESFRQVLCFKVGNQTFCWLLGDNGHLYQIDDNQQIKQISEQVYTGMYHVEDKVFLTTSGTTLWVVDPLTLTFSPNHSDPFYKGKEFTPSNEEGSFFMLLNDRLIYRMSVHTYNPGTLINFNCDWENTLQPEGIGTYYMGEMQLTSDGLVGISRRSYTSGYEAAHALQGVFCTIHPDDESITNLTATQLTRKLTTNPVFQGLTGLAIDPLHEERYVVSTGMHGLYVINHDTLEQRLDHTNTQGGIEAFSSTFASTRTSAVTFDDAGNMFVTCSVMDTLLRCLTPEGRWIKYPHPGMTGVADARRILISQNDPYQLKWVLNDYGYQKSRVGIYYDNGSPTKVGTQDYQTAWFNVLVDQDLNEYLPYYIYDLCEDKAGRIWVLTNLGPFCIDDVLTTFNYAQQNPGRGKVRRVKIPRNDGTNLADYLMESTYCTCMVVDNFDRKWIGTKGAGLYLLSPDCITEIEHFDTDNSPLLSDDILDLCYDHESGQLYISCEGGVLTYQTDAIEGEDDMESIYCYPNPVRPEYSGELRIMGLMNDSHVSITTTDGRLIYRTQSQGATATWNLRTADGTRVQPGVYMIHGVDSEGKKGKITKFLVL